MSIRIVPMTAEMVASLRGPRQAAWEDDYPTEQDLEIADFLARGHFSYATTAQPWGPWVITDDGMAIGGAGFHGPPTDGIAEIGYNLSPSRRGRGIATQVVGLLADLAREAGLRGLVAGTDYENLPSQRVLERSGFVLTVDDGNELRWSLSLTT